MRVFRQRSSRILVPCSTLAFNRLQTLADQRKNMELNYIDTSLMSRITDIDTFQRKMSFAS